MRPEGATAAGQVLGGLSPAGEQEHTVSRGDARWHQDSSWPKGSAGDPRGLLGRGGQHKPQGHPESPGQAFPQLLYTSKVRLVGKLTPKGLSCPRPQNT